MRREDERADAPSAFGSVPVEMSYLDACEYLAYWDMTYGEDARRACSLEVEMPRRDLIDFQRFREGAPIARRESTEEKWRNAYRAFAIWIAMILLFIGIQYAGRIFSVPGLVSLVVGGSLVFMVGIPLMYRAPGSRAPSRSIFKGARVRRMVGMGVRGLIAVVCVLALLFAIILGIKLFIDACEWFPGAYERIKMYLP